MKCQKCNLEWQEPCEQTACIDLFGECISCRRFVLTEDEVKQIQEVAIEAKLREKNDASPTNQA